MTFTTKKYTRPLLVSEIKSLSSNSFKSVTTLANALSPRVGRKGAKFQALNDAVGGVAEAYLFAKGKTSRTFKGELLKRLK